MEATFVCLRVVIFSTARREPAGDPGHQQSRNDDAGTCVHLQLYRDCKVEGPPQSPSCTTYQKVQGLTMIPSSNLCAVLQSLAFAKPQRTKLGFDFSYDHTKNHFKAIYWGQTASHTPTLVYMYLCMYVCIYIYMYI